MGAQEIAILRAIEERLTTIEGQIAARSAPAPEIRQALDDILRIYSLTGQTAEVAHSQRDQIQALTEAWGMMHSLFQEHDRRELLIWDEVRELMVQLRELARKQVRQLDNTERMLGMSQAERAAARDVRPEEQGL